jgi:hypothetical protein
VAETSGQYEFQQPPSVELIFDAYERAGVIRPEIKQERIDTAKRSLNFILQSWVNKGLCLWTVKEEMLGLNPGQTTYRLPDYTSDVLDVTLRTSNRNLGGTAFSSAGGTAQNAFDGNNQTACVQSSADGYISYNWNAAQHSISLVGIQSNVTRTYTLVFEHSFDNSIWIESASEGAQTFPDGEIIWFVVPVPVSANVFRVRESGGAILNIQELYFNNLVRDIVITRASRSEYISYPNKKTTGNPSTYYINRQINPVISFYPTPNSLYNNVFYTRVKQIEDVGALIDSAAIPTRFLEALCSDLAHRLAIKEKERNDISKIQYLKGLADEEFRFAKAEDGEKVPIRIYGDYSQGWARV